jgi:hypothetical protein
MKPPTHGDDGRRRSTRCHRRPFRGRLAQFAGENRRSEGAVAANGRTVAPWWHRSKARGVNRAQRRRRGTLTAANHADEDESTTGRTDGRMVSRGTYLRRSAYSLVDPVMSLRPTRPVLRRDANGLANLFADPDVERLLCPGDRRRRRLR